MRKNYRFLLQKIENGVIIICIFLKRCEEECEVLSCVSERVDRGCKSARRKLLRFRFREDRFCCFVLRSMRAGGHVVPHVSGALSRSRVPLHGGIRVVPRLFVVPKYVGTFLFVCCNPDPK